MKDSIGEDGDGHAWSGDEKVQEGEHEGFWAGIDAGN